MASLLTQRLNTLSVASNGEVECLEEEVVECKKEEVRQQMNVVTAIYKYHVSYPSLNRPMKINFNTASRGLSPTLPRDKRCIFQFATRTKTSFKRIHSHTLVGSSYYLHSGLCDKSKLAQVVEAYFRSCQQQTGNDDKGNTTVNNSATIQCTTNTNPIYAKTCFIPSPSFVGSNYVALTKQIYHLLVKNTDNPNEHTGNTMEQPWCLKAANVNNGLGVKFYKNLNTLASDMKQFTMDVKDKSYIIQPYIQNTLKYQNKKCHIRLNFLVVGGRAHIYVHRDCVVHVAAKAAVPAGRARTHKDAYDDHAVHLTNHVAKKGLSNNNSMSTQQHIPTKIITLLDLEKDRNVPNLANCLFEDMCNVIKQVFAILNGRGDLFLPVENTFEMFGADFLVQTNENNETGKYKCILLEINSGPGLEGRVNPELCTKIMNDTLKIVFDPWYKNLCNTIGLMHRKDVESLYDDNDTKTCSNCNDGELSWWMDIDEMPSNIPDRYCYIGAFASHNPPECSKNHGDEVQNRPPPPSNSSFLLSRRFMKYLYNVYQYVVKHNDDSD